MITRGQGATVLQGFSQPLKIGEVLLTKLMPGWHQAVASCTVEICTAVQMIWTQIVDNT